MQSQTGFAPVNGAQLYYEMAGTGQPIILLHAGVADGRMWDDQFDSFAKQYHTIRYDMRSFGRSAMPEGRFSHHDDLAGLLDYLHIAQAVVVGSSYGGKVALDFALAFPQRVSALVLGAPSVGGTQPSEGIIQFWEAEETALEQEDWETAVELNLRLWVDGPFRQPEEVKPDLRQKVGQMQREIFQMVMPKNVEVVRLEPAANGRLAEINVPTLVMVGELDLPEVVAQAAWLAGKLPKGQHAVIPRAAHMHNMEKPSLFNQLVLDFLGGKSGTQRFTE